MDVLANRACGACLAQMRREACLTQVDLAAALNVPQSFISKVEIGERSLRLYEVFDYARALGVPATDLVTRIETALSEADAERR
ncbi:MAG TPA: helix-turn-helix domain-containing protein [Candidatus Collinsella stercoripullorum]|nr:helix-turn-helix domain-containing protein [Candidatus Collinsella stercoripullorum]